MNGQENICPDMQGDQSTDDAIARQQLGGDLLVMAGDKVEFITGEFRDLLDEIEPKDLQPPEGHMLEISIRFVPAE